MLLDVALAKCQRATKNKYEFGTLKRVCSQVFKTTSNALNSDVNSVI